MTSAVAGYLQPSIEPIDDDALDDFLHGVMVGISGLSPEFVRPRFQLNPPAMPSREVDWVGFGVHEREVEKGFAYQEMTDGATASIRHERLTLIASFYGPQASLYASRFRDGLQIAQNVAELSGAGMGLVETIGPRKASELIKQEWRQRQDLTIYMNRELDRVYPVLSLLSAVGGLVNDIGAFQFDSDGADDPDQFIDNRAVVVAEDLSPLITETTEQPIVSEAP